MNTTWTADCDDVKNITMAIPPHFAGPGGGASPEDLYALALLNCLIATFKVFAEKSNLPFEQISGEATLTPGKDATGKMIMKSIAMSIKVVGSTDKEKCQKLVEKASASCMIINSVNTEKSLTIEIV